MQDVPESLQGLTIELPLLLDSLRQSAKIVEIGAIRDEARDALTAVVNRCEEQIDQLNDLLQKVTPSAGDSRVRKTGKALLSFKSDPKMQRIALSVRQLMQTLMYHHTTSLLLPSSSRFPETTDDLQVKIKEAEQKELQQARKDVLDWLDAASYDPEEQLEEALSNRLEGTNEWIFEVAAYREWFISKPTISLAKIMWIFGPAGFGKSTLCAKLITSLRD